MTIKNSEETYNPKQRLYEHQNYKVLTSNASDVAFWQFYACVCADEKTRTDKLGVLPYHISVNSVYLCSLLNPSSKASNCPYDHNIHIKKLSFWSE